MRPREINPECIDDDAFWDIEALKLAVLAPGKYNKYISESPRKGYHNDGSGGLYVLGFLTQEVSGGTSFDTARIANFGQCLIDACLRLSDKTIEQ